MPQPLFHYGEQFGVIARFGIEQPFGRDPRLRQSRREQIMPSHRPEQRPMGSRGNAGKEQCRGTIVRQIGIAPREFVQGVDSYPPVRQPRIQRIESERQRGPAPKRRGFDRAQGFAQLHKGGRIGHWRLGI